jgi:peptide/nickel transport system permease protein
MFSYLVHRLVHLGFILLGVTVMVFLMLRFLPGDPALILAGEETAAEQVEELRHKMGLDRSYPVQYWMYMKDLFHGNMGVSLHSGTPVSKEIFARLVATIELTLAALAIASFFGIGAGVISSIRQYSLYDYLSMVMALLGVSTPIFWLGLMLIYVLSVKFPILPMMSRLSIGMEIQPLTGFLLLDALLQGNMQALGDAIRHLLLPAFTLATIPMALVARMTRSSMLEVLNRDYVRTARAKGLSEKLVIWRHALRNALLPIVTVLGLNLGVLLGGSVITEVIFSWPGLGRYVVGSLLSRDYPAVQGCILVFAALMVIINLAVDLLYVGLDPRIRLQ